MPLALPTVIVLEPLVSPPVSGVKVSELGLFSVPNVIPVPVPVPVKLRIVLPGPAPRRVLYDGTEIV